MYIQPSLHTRNHASADADDEAAKTHTPTTHRLPANIYCAATPTRLPIGSTPKTPARAAAHGRLAVCNIATWRPPLRSALCPGPAPRPGDRRAWRARERGSSRQAPFYDGFSPPSRASWRGGGAGRCVWCVRGRPCVEMGQARGSVPGGSGWPVGLPQNGPASSPEVVGAPTRCVVGGRPTCRWAAAAGPLSPRARLARCRSCSPRGRAQAHWVCNFRRRGLTRQAAGAGPGLDLLHILCVAEGPFVTSNLHGAQRPTHPPTGARASCPAWSRLACIIGLPPCLA